MPTGAGKWVNITKGCGFIAPDDGGKDVFLRISAVEERAGPTGLAGKQTLAHEIRAGPDGRAAALRCVH